MREQRLTCRSARSCAHCCLSCSWVCRAACSFCWVASCSARSLPSSASRAEALSCTQQQFGHDALHVCIGLGGAAMPQRRLAAPSDYIHAASARLSLVHTIVKRPRCIAPPMALLPNRTCHSWSSPSTHALSATSFSCCAPCASSSSASCKMGRIKRSRGHLRRGTYKTMADTSRGTLFNLVSSQYLLLTSKGCSPGVLRNPDGGC